MSKWVFLLASALTAFSQVKLSGNCIINNAALGKTRYAFGIAGWGDSLILGFIPYLQNYFLTNGPVYNGGVGGEGALQIATRVLADTAHTNWPSIFWAGVNDASAYTGVLSNISNMVSHITSPYYLTISVFIQTNYPFMSVGYSNAINLNRTLAATYPGHYFDLRSFLVTQTNGSAQDTQDYTNDMIPTSLRVGATDPHLNSTGYTVAATQIYNYIITNGWKYYSVP